MSHTHRYLLALPRGDRQVFLSWRLLASDAPDAPFHVERLDRGAWTRVTEAPIVESTTALVHAPDGGLQRYRIAGPDGTPSETVEVNAGAKASLLAREIPLLPGDRVQDVIVGDLGNDGRLGYVVRAARDNTIHLIAYGHEGDVLWEVDTRLPARGGWDGSMHHCPFLCWDLNGDGRSEVAFHSYPDTYPTETYDTAIEGERFTVVDGATGQLVWETAWPALRSRVMMTVGHLEGLDRPAQVVVLDGTYGDVVLTALNGVDGTCKWQIEQARAAGHNLDIADIDGDGVQEVICGGVCYNGDGTLRWQAEPFGHTDISKPAHIVPDLEGLQVYYAVEGPPRELNGVYLVDQHGRTLWKEPFAHAHYGWIAHHAPGVPGLHPHTAEDSRRQEQDHYPIFLPDGSTWLNLTDWQRKNFVPVHWDEGPEVVFVIRKENKRIVRLLPTGEIEDLPYGKVPEGGEYGRNLGCVDLLGDYRENIVAVDAERHCLMVLANPTVATQRGTSPWDDFAYRHDRSQLGSGYYIYLSPPVTTV
jgi:rhamnogalacturonan endolyase